MDKLLKIINYAVNMLFNLIRLILDISPKNIQKLWMIGSLWAYRQFFNYLNIIISAYHNGVSPKHIYSWGMHNFFLKYVNRDMTVLDIGCGDGTLTGKIAEKVKKIVAYDCNPQNIEIAKRINNSENIRYFVGDALQDLPQVKFDVVILSSILSFVDDVRLLNNLHNITDTLLIRETRYDNCYTVLLSEEYGIPKSIWAEYTMQELLDLLSKTGWKVADIWDTYDMFLKAESMDEYLME